MIGARIRLAREATGKSQSELAEQIGYSQGMLSDVEQGNVSNPAPALVEAVALATGFPLSFFHLGPLPDFPEGSWRRLKRGSARVTAQVRAQARHIAETVQHSEAGLNIPPVLFEPIRAVSDGDALERLALDVRGYLRVGPEDPIPHMCRAVERAGVIVAVLPIEMPDHDGFSVWPDRGLDGRPLIVLAKTEAGDRARFTLAHEFGHLFLHTDRVNVDYKTAEAEANRFAGALLLPRKVALRMMRPPVTLGLLARVKETYGTSIAMNAKRALDLNIIDQDHFVSLRKQLSARGWNRSEPVIVEAEKPILLNRILEARAGTGTWKARADRVQMNQFAFKMLAST
jgi:Zn-dependent peptidase ImmA (M78 family)/DNA-binding XRE family transcriptional regulator